MTDEFRLSGIAEMRTHEMDGAGFEPACLASGTRFTVWLLHQFGYPSSCERWESNPQARGFEPRRSASSLHARDAQSRIRTGTLRVLSAARLPVSPSARLHAPARIRTENNTPLKRARLPIAPRMRQCEGRDSNPQHRGSEPRASSSCATFANGKQRSRTPHIAVLVPVFGTGCRPRSDAFLRPFLAERVGFEPTAAKCFAGAVLAGRCHTARRPLRDQLRSGDLTRVIAKVDRSRGRGDACDEDTRPAFVAPDLFTENTHD